MFCVLFSFAGEGGSFVYICYLRMCLVVLPVFDGGIHCFYNNNFIELHLH